MNIWMRAILIDFEYQKDAIKARIRPSFFFTLELMPR